MVPKGGVSKSPDKCAHMGLSLSWNQEIHAVWLTFITDVK